MYQALYRKWRPKTFSDVVGQSHITEILQKQVAEERTSHAYLFTGTRGTGKTTCAKILAKAVNCRHPLNGNPCNECDACRGIENGSFLDVLELDAASNNGVDQVRALRDEAIYSPANVKKRVYIIDEVHMLSSSAFNALLKILEEPPEHLMFILATTELHKVLPTILSRCQRYSFKRIQPQDIVARLEYVAQQEQIDLSSDAADLLARLADGALRDALSLLDQCAASGTKIDVDTVLNVLGLIGGRQTAQLLHCVIQRDNKAALLLFHKLYNGGKDVRAILNELSTLTRDLLLQKTIPDGNGILLSGTFDPETIAMLSRDVTATRLFYLSATLQKAAGDLYYSASPRTDAELCLLRLCDESLSGDVTAVTARLDRLEKKFKRGSPVASAPSQATAFAPLSQTESESPPLPEEPAMTEQVNPLDEAPPLPEEPPMMDVAPPWEEPADSPTTPAVLSAPAEASSWKEPTSSQAVELVTPFPAVPQQPAGTIPAVPAQSAASTLPTESTPLNWPAVSEACKGRLSPMYRAFLDLCKGVQQENILMIYAPDDMTKKRLDNDRVITALQEVTQQQTGAVLTVHFTIGVPPATSPKDNLKHLIQFGSQFDNVTVK